MLETDVIDFVPKTMHNVYRLRKFFGNLFFQPGKLNLILE